MTELSSECTEIAEANFHAIDLSSITGFREGISETIVSTGLEYPNAAPIGIISKRWKAFCQAFQRQPYLGKCPVKKSILAANIVYDPLLFVRSTFFDLESSEFDYVSVSGLNFPILKEAIAWVVFECINLKNTDQALVADLIPLEAGFNEANKKGPSGALTGDSMQCLRLLSMQPAISFQETKNTLN